MKIISGKHRGRNIAMKQGKDIRPTTGRTRESIFNILSHGQFGTAETSPIFGRHVVDLFCGSGALGLEALSRGAQKVTFIDQSQDSLNLARDSAKAFGETGNCRFIRSDSTVLPTAHDACALAFLDPPYNSGLAPKALASLAAQGWLAPDAVCMVEISAKETLAPPPRFSLIMDRVYGNSKIVLLRFE